MQKSSKGTRKLLGKIFREERALVDKLRMEKKKPVERRSKKARSCTGERTPSGPGDVENIGKGSKGGKCLIPKYQP